MRAADIRSARAAVWGLGREGRAAITFLRQRLPNLPLLALDDATERRAPDDLGDGIEYVFGADRIARALKTVDLIVKSPGVSLYRPEIRSAQSAGVHITSLLNLWFTEHQDLTTICVTGTKGKSTTASLIAHILAKLGQRAALAGNIGVPVTGVDGTSADIAVIEVSSYQAADFDGLCDISVLTSLYPEHIDWHRSVDNYFRDKTNLLNRSRRQIIHQATSEIVARFAAGSSAAQDLFEDEFGVHSSGAKLFDNATPIGKVKDPYLLRTHNRSNLCAALAVAKTLNLDLPAALEAANGFRGLPHRQQELGELGGVLFVDDSISTIPESTFAALAVYSGREITVILGGHDRGVEYGKLVETVLAGAAGTVICLGEGGKRIFSLAQRHRARRRGGAACKILRAESMAEAVAYAREVTPPGGVVLLSPAAPSYGQYRDYIERGHDFAAKAGFPISSEPHSYSDTE